MSNPKYIKGRRAEYKTMEYLREQGYSCFRSAGSHGPWDVIAEKDDEILHIQVKRDCNPTKAEIEEMGNAETLGVILCRNCGTPTQISFKEVWRWNTRESEPEITEI